ncbi:unnamed protein product [Amoebophrya sp. A120]|nr:unnamed protein product [Amoebophrya sp. A120]|eukprot:GSA120T00001036001.1
MLTQNDPLSLSAYPPPLQQLPPGGGPLHRYPERIAEKAGTTGVSSPSEVDNVAQEDDHPWAKQRRFVDSKLKVHDRGQVQLLGEANQQNEEKNTALAETEVLTTSTSRVEARTTESSSSSSSAQMLRANSAEEQTAEICRAPQKHQGRRFVTSTSSDLLSSPVGADEDPGDDVPAGRSSSSRFLQRKLPELRRKISFSATSPAGEQAAAGGGGGRSSAACSGVVGSDSNSNSAARATATASALAPRVATDKNVKNAQSADADTTGAFSVASSDRDGDEVAKDRALTDMLAGANAESVTDDSEEEPQLTSTDAQQPRPELQTRPGAECVAAKPGVDRDEVEDEDGNAKQVQAAKVKDDLMEYELEQARKKTQRPPKLYRALRECLEDAETCLSASQRSDDEHVDIKHLLISADRLLKDEFARHREAHCERLTDMDHLGGMDYHRSPRIWVDKKENSSCATKSRGRVDVQEDRTTLLFAEDKNQNGLSTVPAITFDPQHGQPWVLEVVQDVRAGAGDHEEKENTKDGQGRGRGATSTSTSSSSSSSSSSTSRAKMNNKKPPSSSRTTALEQEHQVVTLTRGPLVQERGDRPHSPTRRHSPSRRHMDPTDPTRMRMIKSKREKEKDRARTRRSKHLWETHDHSDADDGLQLHAMMSSGNLESSSFNSLLSVTNASSKWPETRPLPMGLPFQAFQDPEETPGLLLADYATEGQRGVRMALTTRLLQLDFSLYPDEDEEELERLRRQIVAAIPGNLPILYDLLAKRLPFGGSDIVNIILDKMRIAGKNNMAEVLHDSYVRPLTHLFGATALVPCFSLTSRGRSNSQPLTGSSTSSSRADFDALPYPSDASRTAAAACDNEWIATADGGFAKKVVPYAEDEEDEETILRNLKKENLQRGRRKKGPSSCTTRRTHDITGASSTEDPSMDLFSTQEGPYRRSAREQVQPGPICTNPATSTSPSTAAWASMNRMKKINGRRDQFAIAATGNNKNIVHQDENLTSSNPTTYHDSSDFVSPVVWETFLDVCKSIIQEFCTPETKKVSEVLEQLMWSADLLNRETRVRRASYELVTSCLEAVMDRHVLGGQGHYRCAAGLQAGGAGAWTSAVRRFSDEAMVFMDWFRNWKITRRGTTLGCSAAGGGYDIVRTLQRPSERMKEIRMTPAERTTASNSCLVTVLESSRNLKMSDTDENTSSTTSTASGSPLLSAGDHERGDEVDDSPPSSTRRNDLQLGLGRQVGTANNNTSLVTQQTTPYHSGNIFGLAGRIDPDEICQREAGEICFRLYADFGL